MSRLKKIEICFCIAIGICLIGIVLEYGRMKKTYQQYMSYETRMETGLLTQLARYCLEKSDLADFIHLCRESSRYRPDPISPVSQTSLSENGETPSLFTPPPNVGLQSRITLFDEKANVIFDSWVNADTMENHANRPEFQSIQNSSNKTDPYITFERYSTTLQTKMFFCIVKFNAKNEVYFLRVGNTLQAINIAGNSERQTLYVTVLLAFLAIGLVSTLCFLFIINYRKRLLEIQQHCLTSNTANTPLSDKERSWMAIDRIIHNIRGEIIYRDDLISRERQIRNMIFQSLFEGVILLDNDGVVLDINEGACLLLEVDMNKVKGHSLFEIWRNLDLEQLYRKNEWRQTILQMEIPLDLPGGTRTLDIRLRNIQWDNKTSGCLLLLYDLTHIRRLENYRRDFVANVSHEIKTPLTVIMGTVEALQDGAINDSNLAIPFMETITRHSKRLYALVQDVLSLSNLESEPYPGKDRFMEESLSDLLYISFSYCEEAAKKHYLVIELEECVDNDKAEIIPKLMEQAFINLIDNAVKYCGGNTSETKKMTIRISNSDNDSVKIEFIDEGPGIPIIHQERIFERFYRVDPSRSKESGGTGLGLSIVKHIVQIHCGTVSVKNNFDKGCTFTICLPRQYRR